MFLRPIIGFGDINITEPTGSSSYNSLQMQLTRRFTGGIELAGAYTWAKGYQNFFHERRRQRHGLSEQPGARRASSAQRSNIQEHVLVASYTVDVPNVGTKMGGAPACAGCSTTGASPASALSRPAAIAGVTFTTTDNFDFTGGGERCGNNNGPFPNVNGDAESAARRPHDRSLVQHRAPSSARAGRATSATTATTPCSRLPGFHNHDISIFKNFPMKGNQQMQFRWEIYNLFDQLSFNEVDTRRSSTRTGSQTDTNFGKVTSARNERRMQFSLRYTVLGTLIGYQPSAVG